ncbi:MAG: hypothetical protein IH857_05255 [Deltaproteobacteria bacterium]|nr:hypothetical protein [Deltaproteobacteria bacterium]
MGKRILGFWLQVIFVAALLFPNALWAGWEIVKWDKVPKNSKGKPENGGTIAIVGKDNVYFTFSGSHIIHWDGKGFREQKHKYTGAERWAIRQLVANSEKDIWAFGDNGLALHSDGKKWKAVKNPLTGTGRREGRLWGSGCATPNKCFSGSRSGHLIEWDGSSWKLVSKSGEPPAGGSRIYAIEFISENNGWMAGEALMAKWDGKGWKKTNIEVPRIYDMAFVGSDFGWIVGDGGAFFKFDGKTWTKVDVKGSFFRMRGVGCSSKDDCWAVGDAGAAFQWDGKGWTKVKLGTFNRLSNVKFGHGHGFIVGQKGTILQWK